MKKLFPIAAVDIMDEEGEIRSPVADDKWIKYDIVGSHIQNYDSMINLAHFKGHAMGGFGGVLKNASIGVASAFRPFRELSDGWHRTLEAMATAVPCYTLRCLPDAAAAVLCHKTVHG